MAVNLCKQAKVLSGHRLELTVPEFNEGETVNVYIQRAEAEQTGNMTREEFFDWLRNLPPSGRTAAEIDAAIEEERNSWD